jgi:predicted AAA+ superfamily ATPase
MAGKSSDILLKRFALNISRRNQYDYRTFREFLIFKNFQITPNIEFSGERFQLINYAGELIKWGGFPRVVLEKNTTRKKEILKDYLEMIIYKDIAERYGVRNTHLLKLIINYALSNFAAEFSVNGFIKKFHKEYRINKDTVFTYFSYLEDIGFLYYLPRFSYKLHQRYVTKKSYIGDNGFILLLSFRGMEVPGRLLENLVFTELLKGGKNIFYYKDSNNYECDFIVTEAEQVIEAVQVCHQLTADNREREVRGMISALRAFGLQKGIIITSGDEEEIKVDSYSILVVPYWKWMIAYFANKA